MSRQSLAKAHQKIQELAWEPAVSRAVHEVRHRLHLPEGAEEGPAQADPPLVLPDGGGEGQPRLRRRGRRDPRQHVPPGAGALAGMAEAVPVDHPAARDLRGPLDADAVPHGSEPGTAQRPGDPDDRRGPALDDPAEPQAPVHEQLHRPGRLQQQPAELPQRLLRHHRPAVRRGVHHRGRHHRGQHLPHHRRGDRVHEHAVRGHAGRGGRQRRLPAADGVPLGAVRRVPAHLQRLRHAADGAVGRGQPATARARPALRVVEQPRRRGRRDRHLHRVRHQGPPQGPGVLRGDVASLDLRRLLPQLPGPAREVRAHHSARPHRGGLEPDLEQGLRARGRAVLRHRVARQLLAHRPDDG